MLQTARKILDDTIKLEPITTEDGVVILSKHQIDNTCDALRDIVNSLSTDPV